MIAMNIDEAVGIADYADQLRALAIGCRLSKSRWGIQKAVDEEQRVRIAELFDAQQDVVSARKTLIDTANERYRAVTSVLSRVTKYWREHTLPFGEDGTRLLRKEHVQEFEDAIARFRAELDGAVTLLDRDWQEILDAEKQRRKGLFRRGDYPESIVGLFSIQVDYPALEPDPALVQVSANLYQRHCQMAKARFEEAVLLAEQQFAAEFKKLITDICDKLKGLNEGTAKRFTDSNQKNLQEFFDRFKSLNIGSSAELDELIESGKKAIEGIAPEWLEESQPLRDAIKGRLDVVRGGLEAMMVNKPKRKISFED